MSSPLAPTEGWSLRNWFWPPNSGSGGSSSTSTEAGVALQGATALRNIVPSRPYEIQTLLFLNTLGDGAGGQFTYMPDDSNADDGIDYIIPNSITRPATGTFVRMS